MSTPLPPTARDFDIHHMSLVQHVSTRNIAQKHGVSQTRVRQVVQRVCDWLATALPVKTEAQQEQETRLAQHLAAAQLQEQCQTLQSLWNGTLDPKYLRQQTRVITALARLGIVPGVIQALAADAITGPFDPNESQSPWSEDDPWTNAPSSSDPGSPERATPPQPETWNLKPETAAPGDPPFEDCSPSSPPSAVAATALADPSAATSAAARAFEQLPSPDALQTEGLNLLEQRLLTLLENVLPDDTDRRESLSRTLHIVRGEKAALELRLSRDSVPVAVALQPSPLNSQPHVPVS